MRDFEVSEGVFVRRLFGVKVAEVEGRVADSGWEKHFEPHTATITKAEKALADVYAANGEHDEALKWYAKRLASKEKAQGKNHVETLQINLDIAVVYREKGDWKRALEGFEKALKGLGNTLEKNDPKVLEAVRGVAESSATGERWEKAVEHYDWLLKEEKSNPASTATLENYKNIALWLKEKKRDGDALGYARRALVGYTRADKYSQQTVDMQRTVATIYTALRGYEEAAQHYQSALKGYDKLHGKEGANSINVAHNLAKVQKPLEQYPLALQNFSRAAQGYARH